MQLIIELQCKGLVARQAIIRLQLLKLKSNYSSRLKLRKDIGFFTFILFLGYQLFFKK